MHVYADGLDAPMQKHTLIFKAIRTLTVSSLPRCSGNFKPSRILEDVEQCDSYSISPWHLHETTYSTPYGDTQFCTDKIRCTPHPTPWASGHRSRVILPGVGGAFPRPRIADSQREPCKMEQTLQRSALL